MTDREMLEKAREFARDISRNYDCDNDAHRYGTSCRCCDAAELLGAIAAHLDVTASPTGPAKEHGPAMTLTTGLAIGGRTVIQPGMVISTPRVPLDLAELPAVKRWQEANPPIRAILLRELRLGATEWRLAADALEAIAEAGRG